MLRTAVSNRLAKVQGFLFRAAFLRRVPVFFRLILENILLCFLQSTLHSTSKYITGTLSLRFRNILTRLIHAQYFQVKIYPWHLPTVCFVFHVWSLGLFIIWNESVQEHLWPKPSRWWLPNGNWHICIIVQWSYKLCWNLFAKILVVVCVQIGRKQWKFVHYHCVFFCSLSLFNKSLWC